MEFVNAKKPVVIHVSQEIIDNANPHCLYD